MKKILLFSSFTLTALLAMGTGCNRLPIVQSNTNAPATKVTHIVMREANPDDVGGTSSYGDSYDIYLTDTASRAEISETIQVDELPADTTTLYFFSDLTARQEYMFTYPNALTDADRAALPDEHPLKQGKNNIILLPIDKRPSGSTDKSFIELLLQPVLTFPTEQLRTNATEPYVITDDYIDELDENSPLERRTSIDPKTNLPTQVQLLDKETGDSIETFVIDEYVVEAGSVYTNDFFTLEGWKKSLPGDDHVVVEEDISE